MQDDQSLAGMSPLELIDFLRRELDLPDAELEITRQQSALVIRGFVSSHQERDKLEQFILQAPGLEEAVLEIEVDPYLSPMNQAGEHSHTQENADLRPEGGYKPRRQY